MTYTAPSITLYPWLGAYPSNSATPDAYGRSQDELALLRGEGVELIPPEQPSAATYPAENLYPGVSVVAPGVEVAASPGGPSLERLWQLSNYDPLFYRGLVATAGYTKAAWQAINEPPPQIQPWVPPRPFPVYIGISSSVGKFESQVSGEF